MKLFSLPLLLCVAFGSSAVPSSAYAAVDEKHLSVEELAALNPNDIQQLLQDWNLQKQFGEAFESAGVDGEALLYSSKKDMSDAFGPPQVSAFQWQRLIRKLSSVFWDTAKLESGATGTRKTMTEEEIELQAEGAQKRRRLATFLSDNMTSSGVSIESDSAYILFSDDNAIFRTDAGLEVHSELVNVSGDVSVSGSLSSPTLTALSSSVDSLQDDVADVEVDVAEIRADTATLYSAVESQSGNSALGMSKKNPAKSCRYILQMGGDAHNGHYWINRDGDEKPYLAYCDMGRGGLELIFKLVAGKGGSAYDLWEDETNHVLYNATSDMNPFYSDNHYISPRLLASWDSAGVKMNAVYASMLIGQREEAYATFSADGTDYMSWFGDDYLIDSTWTDIMSTDKNYFSIEGHAAASRYFYMNANYGGCSSDAGWWVVTGRTSGCDWEIQNDQPTILYSPYGTKSAADGGIDGWQQADTFVVAVDYDVVYDSCRAALQDSGFRARDGQYWISHDGTTDPQLVFCDMEHGGYEMVFKLVTGGVTSARMFGSDAGDDDGYSQGCDLWTDSGRDWPNAASRNVDIHDEQGEYGSGEHYLSAFRHGAFDDSDIIVDHIEVRVITAEETKKYFHFSGMDAEEYDDWFNLNYLHTASYTDMFNSNGYNYFSIAGHADAGRCWFANANYGGCSVDAGWVVVAARDQDGCGWEDLHYYPDVMYSTGSTKSVADSYDLADLMAVFYYWHTE